MDLKEILTKRGYAFEEVDGNLVISSDENIGLVGLRELPDNLVFQTEGFVRLAVSTINYMGEEYNLKNVGKYTFIILTEETNEDNTTVFTGKYFKGGLVSEMTDAYIIKKGNRLFFGETLDEAENEIEFRNFKTKGNRSELIDKIKGDDKIKVKDYRALTNACKKGYNQFIKDNNLKNEDEMTIDEIIELTEGQFGNKKLKRFLK